MVGEIGGAEVVFGTVRPDCWVKATGGSKTPRKPITHVDQAGSNVVKSLGRDICGVQRLVITPSEGSTGQFLVHVHCLDHELA